MNIQTIKNNLVVNWHILESCQFNCKYCYAKWSNASSLPLIFKDNILSEKLIESIVSLGNKKRKIRLSFAGGEPLLDKNLNKKIDFANKQNIKTSIITNGALLDEKFIYNNSKKLSILGISIDSLNQDNNIQIGRTTSKFKTPNYSNIYYLINLAKAVNPEIKIKINTVVNQVNFDENLSEFIEKIKPDKWKILRVLPANENSKEQEITDWQFSIFKSNHQHFSFAQFEDNKDMLNSYLMIDPYGRFFFNSLNNTYGYSKSILDVGIINALKEINFDNDKFSNRYNGEVL